MTTENTDPTIASPQTEPAPTPLISAADVPVPERPTVHIPQERLHPLAEHAGQIAETWSGTQRSHLKGLVGEAALASHLGIPDRLDVEVYTDGGDGGFDLQFRGAKIDVKTVGQHRFDPYLTVDKYKPLRADYYALMSRVSETDVRLIGYAPRQFVANAQTIACDGQPYHVVEQDYLFPFR